MTACKRCGGCRGCAINFIGAVVGAALLFVAVMCTQVHAAVMCFSVVAMPSDTIDGDTFRAVVQIWHGLYSLERVRVMEAIDSGVDAPELHGKEPAKALKAKEFADEWLKRGEVELETCGRDPFGRLLAVVTRGESNLAVDLVKAGLAVPWERKKAD